MLVKKLYAVRIAKENHANKKNYRLNLLVATFGHEQAEWMSDFEQIRTDCPRVVIIWALLNCLGSKDTTNKCLEPSTNVPGVAV